MRCVGEGSVTLDASGSCLTQCGPGGGGPPGGGPPGGGPPGGGPPGGGRKLEEEEEEEEEEVDDDGGGEDGDAAPPLAAGLYTGPALTVRIEPSDAPAQTADLASFAVHRPCYMADTTAIDANLVDASAELVVGSMDFGGEEEYLGTSLPLETGMLVELRVDGIDNHPFHQHVNPFQLQTIDTNDANYFQPGDWHDTIMTEEAADGGGAEDGAVVRYFTDAFHGHQVVHCHILYHEDEGMMGQYHIDSGAELHWPAVQQHDPLCYWDPAGRGFSIIGGADDGGIDDDVDDDDDDDDVPSSAPTPAPTGSELPCPPTFGGCGWCYSGRSTVLVRAAQDSSRTETKQLADVGVGDEIVKVHKVGYGFARVLALPHSPTTMSTFEIRMASQHLRLRHKEVPHLVEATSDHTFIRCFVQGREKDEEGDEALVKAKEIKVGDCLRTLNGDKLVNSIRKVPIDEAGKHNTYTVVTEGGNRDLIMVGGLIAHATDATKMGMYVAV